ncbi:hypothetical protein LCGC14_1816520 [marine sediment metagenome]|uniref:Uncharacterized protein n=1 Tax=marine sediment metagenome TaxID=412755 RepID=A0A0F9JJR9_9ZZZZ
MTAFNARLAGRTPKGRNKKDGNGQMARQRDYNARLGAARFTQIGWNKWSYSWQGNFPTFTLAPGILEDGAAGLIARYSPADIEILFPYGTRPALIKGRLDDEILEIVRLQADVADPLPAEAPIPFMGEPLPYQSIVVEGQEIGAEIGF